MLPIAVSNQLPVKIRGKYLNKVILSPIRNIRQPECYRLVALRTSPSVFDGNPR